MEQEIVPQAKKQNKQRSEQEKMQYYQRWKASQLSRNKFCRREGLVTATFCEWIKRFEKKQSSPVSFISLPVKHEINASDQGVKIYLPNGLRCQFHRDTDIGWIQQLIKGLYHVTATKQ